MAQRPPLTIAEAAQALAVSDKTIRRMLKSGLLHEQAQRVQQGAGDQLGA